MLGVVLGVCPHNFFYVRSLDTCYHINVTQVNRSVAKATCRRLHSNARLVAIETDAEFDFLRREYQRRMMSESRCKTSSLNLY